MSLQIYNSEIYTSLTELVDEKVQLFNEASGGTIKLISGAANPGDVAEEAYYEYLGGLVRDRDHTDRASTVAALDLNHLIDISVKISKGTPPVNIPPDLWMRINRSPEEAAQVVAEQLAGDVFQDLLKDGLAACIASIRNADNGDGLLIHDATNGADTGILTHRGLNSGARLFGDRATAIKAWIMHSGPLHDLYDNALQNSERLFQFENVQVIQDGFGRRLIVTDAAPLVNTGSPEGFNTLGLVEGAIQVEQNSDFFANVDTENGGENIERTWQAEWTNQVNVKGFTWDKTVAQPVTAAKLADEANWTKLATSNKDTAGVMVTSD